MDSDSFYSKLGKKPEREIWMVEFFAPWCGPCQQFAPQYRKLAREVFLKNNFDSSILLIYFLQLQHIDYLYIADVDCVAEQSLCSSQNIRSYPTIRLYPLGSEGLNTIA